MTACGYSLLPTCGGGRQMGQRRGGTILVGTTRARRYRPWGRACVNRYAKRAIARTRCPRLSKRNDVCRMRAGQPRHRLALALRDLSIFSVIPSGTGSCMIDLGMCKRLRRLDAKSCARSVSGRLFCRPPTDIHHSDPHRFAIS